MVYCDTNPNVLKWASEEVVIPYRSPVDKRIHRYYPDFWVKTKKHDGSIEISLIEVKPKVQTKPPKQTGKKRKSGRFLLEMKRYAVNEEKWKAAKKFCEHKNWKFIILTEDQLLSK